ncbi:selenide, water dikinase SelD [Orrella sp. NBD-18]|uniref:Selenide, water dikinase n=1 Tax=Sheuella amnicola TaxID=2707330 RepID=A0A6B2R183_9BURK|nr:selenide, water dikinase SelD [Sheuella amnicola]NDY84002.1 selenide, water dikinase SelD [Sheuella amnicola]
MSQSEPIRLSSLAHGGGCGCKIAPGVLSDILKSVPFRLPDQLLAGNENNEDAAVYRLNSEQAIIATTDFFTPIVDDPYDFGRIAATNAISDVYAMGGQPIFALALLGMPINVLPLDVIRKITEGGQSVCAQAGIPIAGGHSIDTVEPIYGLVVLGLVHPDKLKRNNGAKVGDSLILGKPLGVGVLSAALKQQKLSAEGYAAMLRYTTMLNTPGIALSNMAGVHALTDVTGFGLAGHLLEMCRGAGVQGRVNWSDVPLIPQAVEFAKQKVVTGASGRNWQGYGAEVSLPDAMQDWQKNLLTDPQTSGGLLLACSPDAESEVLRLFKEQGFEDARKIGSVVEGRGIAVNL